MSEVYMSTDISFLVPCARLCPVVFGFRDLVGLVGLMPLGAQYPSKSGLMNKHIVKHIGMWGSQGSSADVYCLTSEGQVRQAVCLFLMRCIIKG